MNPTLQQLRAAIIAKVPGLGRACGQYCGISPKCWQKGHGGPIELADVLMAILSGWDHDPGYTEIVVHTNGLIVQMHLMDDGPDEMGDSVEWNLALSLEDQEQPVIDFLASILITK